MGLDVEDRQRLRNKANAVTESRDVRRIPVTAKTQFGTEVSNFGQSTFLENHAVGRNVEFALLFKFDHARRRKVTWRINHSLAPVPIDAGVGLAVFADCGRKGCFGMRPQQAKRLFKKA